MYINRKCIPTDKVSNPFCIFSSYCLCSVSLLATQHLRYVPHTVRFVTKSLVIRNQCTMPKPSDPTSYLYRKVIWLRLPHPQASAHWLLRTSFSLLAKGYYFRSDIRRTQAKTQIMTYVISRNSVRKHMKTANETGVL